MESDTDEDETSNNARGGAGETACKMGSRRVPTAKRSQHTRQADVAAVAAAANEAQDVAAAAKARERMRGVVYE